MGRARAGRWRVVSDDPPKVEWDEDIPSEPPPPGGGESETDDQPLGTPAGADPDDAPSPGLPEAEPPNSG
jgi:hypothetical protein